MERIKNYNQPRSHVLTRSLHSDQLHQASINRSSTEPHSGSLLHHPKTLIIITSNNTQNNKKPSNHQHHKNYQIIIIVGSVSGTYSPNHPTSTSNLIRSNLTHPSIKSLASPHPTSSNPTSSHPTPTSSHPQTPHSLPTNPHQPPPHPPQTHQTIPPSNLQQAFSPPSLPTSNVHQDPSRASTQIVAPYPNL